MYVWRLFLLLSVAVSGSFMLVSAGESGFSRKNGDAPGIPTTITSNKMTVRNPNNQAVFEGAVVLTRGQLVVNSDKMIVFFHAQSSDARQGKEADQPKDNASMSSTSNRSLERVEAIGHVKIKQENSNATCQKAIYFSDQEKIIMTGDPVAWEKGTRVSGKQITIYLNEGRSVVEGDTRVRIHDDGKMGP
jgi:lipopolysaccharide export system protein LptA